MKWLRRAGPFAFAVAMVAAVACNSDNPCQQANGNWGACDCSYSGGNEWSCNEANFPACPSDATGALTTQRACSYRGPTCVYCQAVSSGAAGTAILCTCGAAAGAGDAGRAGASAGTFWDCSLGDGYTCAGP